MNLFIISLVINFNCTVSESTTRRLYFYTHCKLWSTFHSTWFSCLIKLFVLFEPATSIAIDLVISFFLLFVGIYSTSELVCVFPRLLPFVLGCPVGSVPFCAFIFFQSTNIDCVSCVAS